MRGRLATVNPYDRSTYGRASPIVLRCDFVAFSRWDPLHDLLALHERMNRLGSDDPPGWTPAVDLYETPDRFVLSIELPGLTRDQIKIELQQDILTVRGERAVQHEAGAQFHRVERGHGPFARSFSASAARSTPSACRPSSATAC